MPFLSRVQALKVLRLCDEWHSFFVQFYFIISSYRHYIVVRYGDFFVFLFIERL